MKKQIVTLNILFATSMYYSQTITENYIKTRTYLEPTTLNSNAKTIETVQYNDGLGRAKQFVNVRTSPSGKDVVVHVEYDEYGRLAKEFLPIPQQATQNGDIYVNPFSNATNVYGSEKIFSQKIFDNSPLNRIKQKVQVGTAWELNPINFKYDVNSLSESIKRFETTTIWPNNDITESSIKISTNPTYANGELYKEVVIDEDGNETIEFKNSLGQILLSRKKISTTEKADTYYVYNEYNQLAFIIPPKAVYTFFEESVATPGSTIPEVILNNLCYQYKYDEWRRIAEKKVPGKGWEYMVYDNQDRLVLVQDSKLKNEDKWLFTKYDQFNRPIYTGLLNSTLSRGEQQSNLANLVYNNEKRSETSWNDSGIDVFYTNTAYPFNNIKLLSVNYYDNYAAFPVGVSIPQYIISPNQIVLTGNPGGNNMSTKDLLVSSDIKNIEDDKWTRNYSWYDKKGRVIGTHSINHLGGYTKTEKELDFVGMPKQSKTYHKRTNSEIEKVINETFEYDLQNRLKKHWHLVWGQAQELLADNTYNELSQLINKKVGGNSSGNHLQSIDYGYNIRGWLTKINNPQNLNNKLFGYEIKYQNPSNVSYPSKYNGNISEIDWKTSNGGILKRYNYKYDGLDRLQNAVYEEPLATVPSTNGYDESVTYDLNGNLKTLKRFNASANTPILIDNLDYKEYNGNQLKKVVDNTNNNLGYPFPSGNLIDYDVNGNMINHIDKGIITIKYNYLNLPFGINLSTNQGAINFVYRTDGVKLKKNYSYYNPRGGLVINQSTDYLDGFQYVNGILEFLPTGEGYYDFHYNRYVYQYKDQVGNIRLAYYKLNESLAIDKETNYYPFGLEYLNSNGTYPLNRSYTYGFQEQERQEQTGWNSFKWRNYDPTLGRFFNIDPLSENYAYQSHYNFSENHIVNARELEGLEAVENYDSDYWKGVDFGSFQGKSVKSDIDWAYLQDDGIHGQVKNVNSDWKLLGGDSFRNEMSQENNLSWLGISDIDQYHENRATYESWAKENGGDKVRDEAYMFFGAFAAAPVVLGELAAATGVTSAVTYLQASAIRGSADILSQTLVNGKVNFTQTFINSFVGGGGSSLNKVVTAAGNVTLNTANNAFLVSKKPNATNISARGAASLLLMTAASQGGAKTAVGSLLYEFSIQTVANGGDNLINQEVK